MRVSSAGTNERKNGMSLLNKIKVALATPTIKEENLSSPDLFGGIQGFNTDSVSIVQAEHTIHSDFQRQRSTRSAIAQQRINQINKLLLEHNVKPENYMADLFNRFATRDGSGKVIAPGGGIEGRSSWGEVLESLLNGSFEPNTDLGER